MSGFIGYAILPGKLGGHFIEAHMAFTVNNVMDETSWKFITHR